jgi:hypothetical protein
VSRAEAVLRDPAAVWLGELPVSSPAAPATGVRAGSLAVVATALMPSGNDAAQYQRQRMNVTVAIDHDGNPLTLDRKLTLEARVQGSVYLVNFGTTPATVLQLDAWHDWLHPTRWSDDFVLDVEANDAAQADVVLRSEAPGAANGNFTSLTGFFSVASTRAGQTFSPGPTAPQVEFDVEPRTAGTFSVWARARSQQGTGSVLVWADGASAQAVEVGCVAGTAWRWVRLDCARGAAPTTLTLSAAKHTVHVAPSQGHVEIDRVVLTRTTACFAEAPSCSCTP